MGLVGEMVMALALERENKNAATTAGLRHKDERRIDIPQPLAGSPELTVEACTFKGGGD